MAETARIIEKAGAGVVLTRGDDVLPLPGLPDHPLLVPGSAILTVAAEELAKGGAHATFLAPAPGTDGEQLIRVTAFDFARPDLDHLSAAVLVSPSGDLHGLTPLDLRILGLLVEGVTALPALVQALHVDREAVADALGRSLAALRTNDLTAATVRALRGREAYPAEGDGTPLSRSVAQPGYRSFCRWRGSGSRDVMPPRGRLLGGAMTPSPTATARRPATEPSLRHDPLTRGLGVASAALGHPQVTRPAGFARSLGVGDAPRHCVVTELVGVRELAAGAGLLARPPQPGWLWGRVCGDAMAGMPWTSP